MSQLLSCDNLFDSFKAMLNSLNPAQKKTLCEAMDCGDPISSLVSTNKDNNVKLGSDGKLYVDKKVDLSASLSDKVDNAAVLDDESKLYVKGLDVNDLVSPDPDNAIGVLDGKLFAVLEPGPQGPKGDNGIDGVDGEDGAPGPQGERGPQGIQGIQGIQGEQGEQGPRGLQGERGPQGVQGERGERGPRGDTGPQGDRGERGPQGIQGERGPQGLPGERGPRGETGLRGERGPQGDQGERGDKGDRGVGIPEGGVEGDIIVKTENGTKWETMTQVVLPTSTGVIEKNTQYTIDNPFPGYYVHCKAQIKDPTSGDWFDATWVCYSPNTNATTSAGVSVVEFGNSLFIATGTTSCSLGIRNSGTPVSVNTSAECRIVVTKLGKK